VRVDFPARHSSGEPPKRVLIFTADTGFGHRSTSRAISAALEQAHGADCECIIRSLTTDRRVPSLLRNSQRNYDNTVRGNRTFYWLTYAASDSLRGPIGRVLTALLHDAVRDIIAETKPDAIVATHYLYNGPINAVLAESARRPPYFTIVTDLADVHRLWFQPSARACFVATEEVREQALAAGLPEQRVVLSGIPINPQFADGEPDKAALRATLGWEPELTTLLAVGSRRMRHLVENMECLNRRAQDIQLVVVAGGDNALYRELRALEWRVPTHVYGYVDEIPSMMGAADILMTKAGGLILAESLACGLPTILIDAIPGQESGNAAFLARHGAGVVTRKPIEALRALERWVRDDRAELRRISKNARMLGHPFAAFCVAEAIWRSIGGR
jgi:UDP-N-acetylglucosamine:LPS N-acetylglucosamine transferase